MRDLHLMIFDPYSQGHHAEMIRHLVTHWSRFVRSGTLDVVVSPRLLEWDPALAGFVEEHAAEGVRLFVEEEAATLEQPRRFGLLRAGLAHRRLIRRHVQARRPDHVLLMYFDHAQLALGFDLRFDHPVRFSGIYFRPSFYYDAAAAPSGPAERMRQLRKTTLLTRALRNPHFETLFTLDPLAVPAVRALVPGSHPVHLPEPMEPMAATRPADELRQVLGVEPGRLVLLLFGALAERKGVNQLLEALLHLGDEETARLCVVMAGRMMDVDEHRFRELSARVGAETKAQLILRDERIPDEAIADFFGAAHLVLLPYQGHIGSSGILIRAAYGELPVIGSDYGLLGEQIRRRRLGAAVDASDPRALAGGIRSFLSSRAEEFFDVAEARRFAGENTVEAFAGTIYREVTPAAPSAVTS